ncbi:unnamed protein product [Gadus morhua 'NCC']
MNPSTERRAVHASANRAPLSPEMRSDRRRDFGSNQILNVAHGDFVPSRPDERGKAQRGDNEELRSSSQLTQSTVSLCLDLADRFTQQQQCGPRYP